MIAKRMMISSIKSPRSQAGSETKICVEDLALHMKGQALLL